MQMPILTKDTLTTFKLTTLVKQCKINASMTLVTPQMHELKIKLKYLSLPLIVVVNHSNPKDSVNSFFSKFHRVHQSKRLNSTGKKYTDEFNLKEFSL